MMSSWTTQRDGRSGWARAARLDALFTVFRRAWIYLVGLIMFALPFVPALARLDGLFGA